MGKPFNAENPKLAYVAKLRSDSGCTTMFDCPAIEGIAKAVEHDMQCAHRNGSSMELVYVVRRCMACEEGVIYVRTRRTLSWQRGSAKTCPDCRGTYMDPWSHTDAVQTLRFSPDFATMRQTITDSLDADDAQRAVYMDRRQQAMDRGVPEGIAWSWAMGDPAWPGDLDALVAKLAA